MSCTIEAIAEEILSKNCGQTGLQSYRNREDTAVGVNPSPTPILGVSTISESSHAKRFGPQESEKLVGEKSRADLNRESKEGATTCMSPPG